MDRIKVLNVLQGEVVLKEEHYAIGFVTKYGVATVRMHELDKFIKQNPGLAKIFKSSVIESEEIIGKFINVRNKTTKYFRQSSTMPEYRIRIF